MFREIQQSKGNSYEKEQSSLKLNKIHAENDANQRSKRNVSEPMK